MAKSTKTKSGAAKSTKIKKGAVKVIEIIGLSGKSFEDAVSEAIKKASESVEGITGVEVLKFMATVENAKITQYRADVKLAFGVK